VARGFGLFGAVVFFAIPRAAALDARSEALIDEIVAGVEVNEALLQNGTATYSIRTRGCIGSA